MPRLLLQLRPNYLGWPGRARGRRRPRARHAGASAAIRILERLREAGPAGRPAGLLSRELAINRSSQAGQRWTVGPRLSQFGTHGAGLAATLQEELETLTRAFPFVVAFAVQRSQEGSFVIVAKAEVAQLVRLTVEGGRRSRRTRPPCAVCSTRGRAAPAHARPRRRIRRTRWGPYASAGTRSACASSSPSTAPSRRRPSTRAGRCAGGLCVLAFASRLHAANVADVAQAVVRAAQRVSERAGGIWPESAGM